MLVRLSTVILVCSLGVLALSAAPVQAGMVEGIYKADVSVPNQSASEQTKAINEALIEVLVKASGLSSASLLENPLIKQKSKQATSFVQGYRYLKVEKAWRLVVTFDQLRIEGLLRSARIPVWGQRRPETLLWLVDEIGRQRQIVSQQSNPFIVEHANKAANKRGIELVYPLLDLDDLEQINIYDIWGGFSQQIALASERYQVQSVLSARIYREDAATHANNAPEQTRWIADWLWQDSKKLSRGQLEAKDRPALISQLIDSLADHIAAKYAVNMLDGFSSSNSIKIDVNNVSSLDDYIDVLRFLESLSVVGSAILVTQQGSRSTFELHLLGESQDFRNTINLDKTLRPKVDEFGQVSEKMEFVWTP